MKKSAPHVLKIVIVAMVITILVGSAYTMTEYRSIGGARFTRAINSDFNYLENFFQYQPEESLVSATKEVPMVKVPIIIYHSVRPYIQGESILQDRYDVTPEFFEQQLVYLRDHGYTTIGPNEIANYIRLGTTTPTAKPVMLSFDDGWENQYKYAFPLLKKYKMTATFYVYTKPIDAHKTSYLSWDQIREMDTAGMTIGSHTLSHPLLKHSLPVDIHKEIFESKKVLERELKKPILNFAQPFGYSNPEIESVIKEAGYLAARGTHKGVLHSKADLYDLQGYFVSDNFNDFVYILSR